MTIFKRLVNFVKLISIILITSAIGWELWNIYTIINHVNIPRNLNFIFWIERFAVISHLIEAVIAAFYAPAKQKGSIQYAIYTFFVGTVGLWELFTQENNRIKEPVLSSHAK